MTIENENHSSSNQGITETWIESQVGQSFTRESQQLQMERKQVESLLAMKIGS